MKCNKCLQEKEAADFYYNTILKTHLTWCKRCCLIRVRERKSEEKLSAPWKLSLYFIRSRISKSHNSHKKYYDKGIKNFLTVNDLKTLWFRDKAYLMKRPSIDRLDSNKHYSIDNCRYLEFHENSRLGGIISGVLRNKDTCINGHKFNEENTIKIKNRRYCRECGRIRWRAYRNRKILEGTWKRI